MKLNRLTLQIPIQENHFLELDFSSDGVDIYSSVEKTVLVVEEKLFAEAIYSFYRSQIEAKIANDARKE